MRSISAFLLVLVAAAAPVHAQELASTFDQLRVLIKQDDPLTVTDAGGQRLKGKLTQLSSSRLVLDVAGARREFQSGDIYTIQLRGRDPLDNGAFIGMGVGAGLASAVVASQTTGSGLGWIPIVALVYGGIGSGIGACIDALIHGERLIYARSDAAVSVTPVAGRRGTSVVLSVRF